MNSYPFTITRAGNKKAADVDLALQAHGPWTKRHARGTWKRIE